MGQLCCHAGIFVVNRIRGRALQRIRAAQLAAQPLCVHCLARGRVTPATEIDHIRALVNGGSDSAENRQALCAECHAAKTRVDLGQRQRREFDAAGRPIW